MFGESRDTCLTASVGDAKIIETMKSLSKLLCALPVSWMVGTAFADAAQISQWSVHEIALAATRDYGNPYTDVAVTAHFAGPNGATTTVRGFWDSGRDFKVRFCPTAKGEWTYSIRSSPEDGGLAKSGSLTATPPTPGSHGFLRRDAEHPTSFVFDDGARFTQIFLRSWDQHSNLPVNIRAMAEDSDRPTAALITDLKQRGLLDDTLVIWGGEFGRTVYSQGMLRPDNYGRDHHPRCFSMWLAGGGVKPGLSYGETDDFSYNIVKDPMHIRDLHATILHQFGLDHDRLSFKSQGLDQKLTGVLPAKVIHDLLI